jgi:uncharacterized protein (TIGR03546 family)
MIWLKLLGRVINALNKGAAPWQIAGGMVLGFMLGLIPGWPLQCFLLLLVMFILNVNLTIAGVGAVLASASAWIFDPIVDRIGGGVLEMGALQGFWGGLYNWPPMGLTRFNNTVVMGATLLGIVGAIIWFPILIWAVRVYRATVLQWLDRQPIVRMLLHSRAFTVYQRIVHVGFSR